MLIACRRALLVAFVLCATRSGAASPALAAPVFVLDVGAAGDADPSTVAFLDEMPRLSAPQGDPTRTWRSLDETGYLYFHVRPEGVDLAPNGVPYRHAIVDVTFQDTVDEANCGTVKSTRSYCRPRLATRLEYGAEPMLTWLAIGGLGGLNTGEWTTTSIFLEATPWQTLRAIDGYFEFYVFYPNQLGEWRPLPIDEIRLRLVDGATFEAEREADRAARTLVRSEHVDDRPLDPALAGLPYAVYARDYLAKIYPNTVPAPDWVTDTLGIFEIAGEREPLTFAVYGIRDVRGVTVRATDLVSARGTIPASSVDLALVGIADKRWGYGYDRFYGRNPWVLGDLAPFDVPAGTSRQVWATVDVPADAPPGDYAGSLVLEPDDAPPTTIDVLLTVYSLDLAAPDATPYVYHSPYLRGKYFAPHRSTVARDMAAHDINPIIYLDAEIDLHEFAANVRDLPAELAEFQSLGILPPDPRVGISDNADALWRLLCPGVPVFTATCSDFDAAYVHVLDQYETEFAAFGVVPSLSYTDEPGNDPERRIRSNYLNRLTHVAGMTTWVTYYPRCEEALAGYRLTFADLAGSDDRDQVARLILDLPADAVPPRTLTFSIDDAQVAPDELETTKTLTVNGHVAWSQRGIDLRHELVSVDDWDRYAVADAPVRLELSVTNGDARQEDLRVYFVEDYWRRAPWTVETSANWHADFQPDDSGALGPMDPHLDDRVYALSYVSGAEIDRTRAAGDTFSYYTTYPATQPVIVNNRFLNGIYASALGATGVYVYAYGDWGAQPWDDTEPSYVERIGSDVARRSQNNYELVLPSWDDRVYDTVVYEALREGIEDSRVIATLERAIAAHPGRRADEARAYLDDLFSRVSRDYAPRYMSYRPDAPIDRYADRSGEMLADLAGDPEAFGFFDAARSRMIREILALESPGGGPSGLHVPYAARTSR